jgi:serine/threonine protein kinase
LLWSVGKMIEIGHGIGNYRITAKLGEGGMGVVFLAEHPVIGRKVALKAIHPQFARNTEVVSRFVNEAKAVNQIRHEHIVDVTDFGHTPAGDFYFIMECLQGETLADCLLKEGRLAPQRALRIAAQIADALQASHDHGVIHRDLKPDNVFLTRHGDDGDFVKVLDFGLAKLVRAEDMSPRNTRSGSLMGTPLYMSPEQCDGTVEIDHRADIYALGVLLFEMLTGKVPFAGTGYGQVILQHMTARPPAARSIVPELPLALEAILSRALAKDRELRFQSMAELRDALLDPARYLAAIPLPRTDDDSGNIRVAPFSTDVGLRSTLLPGADRDRSTLDDHAGQLGASALVSDEIPRTRSGRALVLAALAATAVIVLPTASYERPVARVVAAAHAFRRPPTVRLTFTSEPEGATVLHHGAVLGITPFSAEVPRSDAPDEYVVRQEGFVSKTLTVVPSVASPVIVSLARQDLPDDPPLEVRPAPETMSVAAADSRRELRAGRPHRHRGRPSYDVAIVDEDETLEPTVE